MSELRWHPYLREWVITATHRQNRTFLPPKEYCPLCPTKDGGLATEIPYTDYDIVTFDNRFPSMQSPAPQPAVEAFPLCPVKPADGVCEVVLYTSRHDGEMADMPVLQIAKLIEVWADRYEELGSLPQSEYVLIFENKGAEIGVTIDHPHGQIYAYPFIPPVLAREVESAVQYFAEKQGCMFCDVTANELKDGTRVVAENEHVAAYIPFFARFPYETHVVMKRHISSLLKATPEERWSLAEMLRQITGGLRALWDMSVPYIMLMHQAPTKGEHSASSHLYVQFLPFKRTPQKLKYLAGSEQAGSFINDTLAEEKAAELRTAAARVQII
ncbi:MAG: galactose-1-phosphate uridylyltransferase [Armatimonadota bacterium]